jgi:hypothetical protein
METKGFMFHRWKQKVLSPFKKKLSSIPEQFPGRGKDSASLSCSHIVWQEAFMS